MKKILILAFGLLLLISLVGLTGFYTSSESGSNIYSGKLENTKSTKKVLDVPYIEQKKLYCSEASAAMVLHYYGYTDITQEYVNENIAYNFERMLLPLGTSLKHYLENAKYAALNIEDLKNEIDENDPVIIRLTIEGVRHTIVVVGYDKNYIYVHDPDPNQGKYLKFSPEILLDYWIPVEDGYLSIIID